MSEDTALNRLLKDLMEFVDTHTCPVNENCVPGFVSGAHTGWGWARQRVREIVEKSVKRSVGPQ